MVRTNSRSPCRFAVTATAISALASAVASLALATAGTASAEEVAVPQRQTIKAFDSIDVRVDCPDAAPYLINREYAPARMVPVGIEVIEDGGIGVTMSPVPGREDTERGKVGNTYVNMRLIGANGTATNWNGFARDVTIIAHCTSDRLAGKEAVQ